MIVSTSGNGQQLENPGFEEWEDAGTVMDEPVDWSSIKTSDAGSLINNAAPMVWDRSTDARSGQYCLKLINKSAFSIVATGTICNGRIHADFNPELANSYTDTSDGRWNTPFTWRPDSIAGWIKYFPRGNDRATLKAVLHVGEGALPAGATAGNHVGVATFFSEPGVAIDHWTRFSAPFDYYDDRTPEYILVVITSGDSTIAVDSSYAFYDDLEIIYNNAGVGDLNPGTNAVYANGRSLYLERLPREFQSAGELSLTDLSGKNRWTTGIKGERSKAIPASLTEGIYLLTIRSGNKAYHQKIYIR